MIDLYHITVLSNFARGYNKYTKQYSKAAISESRFPHQFFILKKEELSIGILKAKKLLKKLNLPKDKLIALKTQFSISDLHNDHLSGVAQYVRQNYIPLDSVYFISQTDKKTDPILKAISIEEMVAQSFDVLDTELLPWQSLKPRTLSILPIAIACQADCKFCFSKASVSINFSQAFKDKNWNTLQSIMKKAKERGALRAVITGGGEPTLLKTKDLLRLIQDCSENFRKVVMISNGHLLGRMKERELSQFLILLEQSGLSTLAISRHHFNPIKNSEIMSLDTCSENLSHVFFNNRDILKRLSLRYICVLQKEAIQSVADIEAYLTWSSAQHVQEVCFKELYVSTTQESVYSSLEANDYSLKHQVSLNIVHAFIEKYHWHKVNVLPWGAPIYQGIWDNKTMTIAAYTEPSVYWERMNGVARSWNFMSDGTILASLEDPNSEI